MPRVAPSGTERMVMNRVDGTDGQPLMYSTVLKRGDDIVSPGPTDAQWLSQHEKSENTSNGERWDWGELEDDEDEEFEDEEFADEEEGLDDAGGEELDYDLEDPDGLHPDFLDFACQCDCSS